MSKHTPGPWVICENALEEGDIMISASKESSPDGGFPFPIAWADGPEKPSMADARLIAAAPDLLKACQATIHYLEQYADLQRNELWGQVAKAVRKATTQQSNGSNGQ